VHGKKYANRPDGIKDKYKYAVIGVFFDTKLYDKIDDWVVTDLINPMFESLKWDSFTQYVKEHKTYKVENKIGQFLNYVEAENRWTYDGSLTTPPCSTKVQWNVVKRVFPLDQKYL
jgi:hypothetical protein